MIRTGDRVIGIETASEKRKEGYLALDYDQISQKEAESDTRRIQQKFHLGTAVLVRTQHGYHVIYFWNNLTWKKIMETINYSHCDQKFKDFTRSTHVCRIRVQGNLKILKMIKSLYHKDGEVGNFYFENYKRAIKKFTEK